jgi:mannose/fructose/N-acetylgalactosamine-specific phosphotransferase system component IIC
MAENGNALGIDILNTLNTFGWAIGGVICSFLGIYFGVELVQKIVDSIPGFVSAGLGSAAGMLPALGFGMLLMIIASKKTWSFFFIGFLVATYTNMNAVGIAILGASIALLYDQLIHTREDAIKA